MLNETRNRLGTAWCNLMHDSAMWPAHGEYQCRTCGRRYPVAWANSRGAIRFRRALLLLAIALGTFWPRHLSAAEAHPAVSVGGAGQAFARYITGLNGASAWSTEDVEIEASLPRLAKQGQLHAIRRSTPLGEPDYQVLELAGDPTVRRQVIARYLSAERTASTMPSAATAITPANYNFRYAGATPIGTTVAYVFHIKPRKKREGLIRGDLWLDAETGAAVRVTGYLVKSSSIFVKRVDLTREVTLQNGHPVERFTYLSVETRIAGPAKLTIREAPRASDGEFAGAAGSHE